MADAQISLEEAESFLKECKLYALDLENLIANLKGDVEHLGQTWDDADYESVCGMTEELSSEVSAALTVANEEIIPYVAKKVETLKSK